MGAKSMHWFLLDSTSPLGEMIGLIQPLQLWWKPASFIFYEGKYEPFQ